MQQNNFTLKLSIIKLSLPQSPTTCPNSYITYWSQYHGTVCFISHLNQSREIIQQNQDNSERTSLIKCCVQQTDMSPIFLSRKDNIGHTCIVSYLDTLCCFSSIVSSWESAGLIKNRQKNFRPLLLLGVSEFQPVKICSPWKRSLYKLKPYQLMSQDKICNFYNHKYQWKPVSQHQSSYQKST